MYIFSIGPDGLRGCVDRIVQNAEQQVHDRSSGTNTPQSNYGGVPTTTISRTYINTTSSNYSYPGSGSGASISNLINQSTAAPNHYQSLSNYYRNVPSRDDASNNSSFHGSATPRDYTVQDPSHRTSIIRSPSRESSIRGDQQSETYETISNV